MPSLKPPLGPNPRINDGEIQTRHEVDFLSWTSHTCEFKSVEFMLNVSNT